MKRDEFIKELRSELSGLAHAEIEDIVRDQEEFIREAVAAGREEADVLRSLGSPRDLAKNLKAEIRIDQAAEEKKLSRQIKGIFGAALALLVLAPFNLIFVLGPLVALLAVIFAGWMVAFAVPIAAVAMTVVFFVKFIFVSAGLAAHLSTLFTFLGFVGLGILFCSGMYAVTKLIFKMIMSYLKWNFNFIRNQA